MKSVQAPLAEFLGSFFLCFAGIAAILNVTFDILAGGRSREPR